jgi:tripartite ATP-independent transporter DctM subunit
MTSFLTLFVGLLAAGMPVFLVLGLCAGAMFMASGQPLVGAAQLVINELNSPTLMALPLFVMAATFMRFGGIANALVNLATAWLGGLPGSLGLVTVVACTLFAAICGSSVATALAMGTILIPAMLERGYPRSFVLGVVGASGTIGIVIPPSLPLILYGIVAEQSVPRLFLAGILPGLLQAAAFFVWVLYESRRRKFPIEPVLPLRERMQVTLSAVPALLVPLVVMVGIYGGFVTVTEAAALAAVVALCVSLLFYRGFHWTETLSVVANGLRSAASIMFDHRDGARGWTLAHGIGCPRSHCRISDQPSVRDLAVSAGDQRLAARARLLPGGNGDPASRAADPGTRARPDGRRSRSLFDHLHPQHGDRAHPPAGRPESLCAFVDRGGADARGDPRHPAVSRYPADRACHHHLRAGAHAVASRRDLRAMTFHNPAAGYRAPCHVHGIR